MKKIINSLVLVILGLCLASNVIANEKATKEECEAKCKEAAAVINEKGLDAAVAMINDKDGPFVWKDSYVFLFDTDGNMLAHPIKPTLVGTNMMATKDKAGKLFFEDFMKVANEAGEGWVDYVWTKPGSEELFQKTTYVYNIPGKNLIVAAGIYK